MKRESQDSKFYVRLYLFVGAILVAAGLVLLVTPAKAQERYCAAWGHSQQCGREWPYTDCRWVRYCRRHAYVESYQRRYDDDQRDERGQCLGMTLDVLSTEHGSEDNAREAARKLMMAKIQWLHGSQYMDLGNAAEMRWRCSASNAHDTVSGRISEATAKLTGRDGQNMRCALWVRPCKAPREKDNARRER